MIITKEHLKILQNFVKINPALYYQGDYNLSIRSIDKILRAEVFLKDFIDVPFAFYDIGVILPFMKVGNELDITENQIIIKDDCSEFKYRLSCMDRIKNESANPISFESFNLDELNIKFNLVGNKLKEFLSFCSKFNCDTVEIYSKDSESYVMKGFSRNSKSTASYITKIKIEHEHNTDVFIFDISKFIFIDTSDILFEIGKKKNKVGNIIPVAKVKSIFDNIEVKYILIAQSVREKESTDE